VLHESNQLNKPRQGIIEIEVDVRLPHMAFPNCYAKHAICSAIHNHNHRLSKALICFLPTYSLDKKGKDEMYAGIRRADLGGDCIMLWGRGHGKQQVMYIRCQCSIMYRGSKVDKDTGSIIIQRSDYRNTTYSNDCMTIFLFLLLMIMICFRFLVIIVVS
jgi:hypothetical protein